MIRTKIFLMLTDVIFNILSQSIWQVVFILGLQFGVNP